MPTDMPPTLDEGALLPCPHCGRADVAVHGPDWRTNIAVRCACGAQSPVFVAAHGGTRAEAIAAWNRRASLPTSPDVAGIVERLRKRDAEWQADCDRWEASAAELVGEQQVAQADWARVRMTLYGEAATALSSLAAEKARLEKLVSSSEAERYRSCGELVERATTAEAEKARLEKELEAVKGDRDELSILPRGGITRAMYLAATDRATTAEATIAELREELRGRDIGWSGIADALEKAESGRTINDVLANYRAIRRAVQDARRIAKGGSDAE